MCVFFVSSFVLFQAMRDLWYIEWCYEGFGRRICKRILLSFTARAQKQDKGGNTILLKKNTREGYLKSDSKEIRRTSRRGIGDSLRLASH